MEVEVDSIGPDIVGLRQTCMEWDYRCAGEEAEAEQPALGYEQQERPYLQDQGTIRRHERGLAQVDEAGKIHQRLRREFETSLMDVEESVEKAAGTNTIKEKRPLLHPEAAFVENEGMAFT